MTAPVAESVVRLSWEGAVAVVTMDDPGGRNTFSSGLTSGLVDSVESAVADPRTRAVLVEGRPELFCAGGTQRELINFAQGNGSFDTDDFFRVFARCPLPVIASVQGHAIGGGLVLALYADFAVFSERSLYAANFMRYGFTPGMGATHLFPTRFGRELGTEMLFSARNYRGAELRERALRYGSCATPTCPPPRGNWPAPSAALPGLAGTAQAGAGGAAARRHGSRGGPRSGPAPHLVPSPRGPGAHRRRLRRPRGLTS